MSSLSYYVMDVLGAYIHYRNLWTKLYLQKSMAQYFELTTYNNITHTVLSGYWGDIVEDPPLLSLQHAAKCCIYCCLLYNAVKHARHISQHSNELIQNFRWVHQMKVICVALSVGPCAIISFTSLLHNMCAFVQNEGVFLLLEALSFMSLVPRSTGLVLTSLNLLIDP